MQTPDDKQTDAHDQLQGRDNKQTGEALPDAQVKRRYLLDDYPKDGELWYMLAQCQEAEQIPGEPNAKKFAAAEASYNKAIEFRPSAWEPYVRLAILLRKQPQRSGDADAVIDRMVANNDATPQAYYAHGQYWLEYGSPAKALKDAEKAAALDPQSAPYLLLCSAAAQQLDDLPQAEKFAAQALELNKRDPHVYLVAANLAISQKQPDRDKAIELLKQGLVAAPKNPELLYQLANLEIDRKDFTAAGEIIKKLTEGPYDPVQSAYLTGRLQFAKGDVVAAVNQFETLRPRLANRPDLRTKVDLWLGFCYDRIGYVDQRVASYRRAIDDNPQWAIAGGSVGGETAAGVKEDPQRDAAQLGLASALANAGRIDDAIDWYQRYLASINGRPSPIWSELARLQILQQLQLPFARRDWKQVEALLTKLEAANPAESRLPILLAEVYMAQGNNLRAKELLEASREKQPDALSLWLAQAALTFHDGDRASAQKLLDQAQAKFGDAAEIRLERIRELGSGDQAADRAEIAKLREGWQPFSPDTQFSLAMQLALSCGALGDSAQSEELWRQASALRPEYLPAYLYLFDAAAARKDSKALAELLEAIKKTEGINKGPLWCYGEASRCLLLAASEKANASASPSDAAGQESPNIANARAALAAALAQRPRWAKAYELLAQLEILQGDLSAATQNYQSAMQLGDQNLNLIRNLVTLLYRRQRFEDADNLLKSIEQKQVKFSNGLELLASEVSWRVESTRQTPDYERALALAKRAAAASNSYEDYLWLGQLLQSTQHADEARQALNKAVEISPSDVRRMAGAGAVGSD